MTATCVRGVAPEDAAAWAVDGEPVGGVDMHAHVPTCEACQEAVAQVLPTRGLRERLVTDHAEAAARAGERAVRRVRAESTAMLILGTLGGAFGRVARALPDYLSGGAPQPGERGGAPTVPLDDERP